MLNTIEKFAAKSLFALHPKTIEPIETFSGDPKNIVVFSNTALGDTLLSTPAIKSLKRSFPKAHITAVMNPAYTPLFHRFPYLDDIIPYRGKYRCFFQTLRHLKKINPDLILIFHSNGPQDIQLAVMSGAKYILKHPTRSPLRRYLSHNFPQKDQHTIEDRLDLVRMIGGKKLEKTMEIGPPDNEELKEKYRKYKGAVGFQIGAADFYKMWPIERFIELAKRIDEKIIITGVASEWELGQRIVGAVGKSKVVNLCGTTPIEELPYLIQTFRALVTNDTGTMHLAVALKVPTVSLFSATTSRGIGPYQDQHLHRIIQKEGSFIQKLPKKMRDGRAMKLIQVDEVITALEDLLQ